MALLWWAPSHDLSDSTINESLSHIGGLVLNPSSLVEPHCEVSWLGICCIRNQIENVLPSNQRPFTSSVRIALGSITVQKS